MALVKQHNETLGQITTALQPVSAPVERDAPEWELNRRLQTTLDVEQLLNILHDAMSSMLGIAHTAYNNLSLELDLHFGQMARHSCNYSLTIGGENIGKLVFARGKRFSSVEMQQIENLLCLLVYPLRNALMYRDALQMAMKDPLTGSLNRTAMDMMLEKEIELAHRHNTPISLIILDVDHFKALNDKHGHLIGDIALKALVSRIRQCIRGADSLFRFGGEEFTIMLCNTDHEGAMLLAERIRESVENMVYVSENVIINMTVSLGVASLKSGESTQDIFKRADHALYDAKTTGRNCVFSAI